MKCVGNDFFWKICKKAKIPGIFFSKVKTSEHTWGVVGFNIKIWKMSWIFVQSHVGKI